GGEKERIAVRGRPHDHLGADRAGGARLVLDDDTLTEQVLGFVGEQRADEIGRPAGRERNDHLDRARWVVLRLCGCDECASRDADDGEESAEAVWHKCVPPGFANENRANDVQRSALMPVSATTLRQRAVSPSMSAVRSAGGPPVVDPPVLAGLRGPPGSHTTALTAGLRRAPSAAG